MKLAVKSMKCETVEVGIDHPYQLPSNDGEAGQVLISEGNGNVRWGDLEAPSAPIMLDPSTGKRIYRGRARFVNGDRRFGRPVSFPSFGHTNYTITTTLGYRNRNPQAEPNFHQWVIIDKTPNSFNVLMKDRVLIDLGEEYWMEWTVVED